MSDDDKKGTLLHLPTHRRRLSKKDAKILVMSDEIDGIINRYLNEGILDVKTVVGLVAHRLGTLIGRIDRKHEMWQLCLKVMRDRAKV
jgi:hypothetical protein